MAIVTREVSKTKFETGDVPTESQFGDLHDSFQHVNDYKRQLTFTADGTFAIPANRELRKIYILSNVAQTIKIGEGGAGTDDLLPERNLALNEERVVSVNVWARASTKTIYVTCSNITIWVHEVPVAPLS